MFHDFAPRVVHVFDKFVGKVAIPKGLVVQQFNHHFLGCKLLHFRGVTWCKHILLCIKIRTGFLIKVHQLPRQPHSTGHSQDLSSCHSHYDINVS